MANVAVVAGELKFRDGRIQKISVKAENNLVSLIGGIQQISRDVSSLLSELVDKERANGNATGGDEENSDEDDKDTEDPQNSEIQPPSKKSKR